MCFPFDSSCQQHCLDLDECHFFTMYGVKDTPKDHMKCFMFKTCDHLEPCPECTTGKLMFEFIISQRFFYLVNQIPTCPHLALTVPWL